MVHTTLDGWIDGWMFVRVRINCAVNMLFHFWYHFFCESHILVLVYVREVIKSC